MNAKAYLALLLLTVGIASYLPAQEAPGIRLHGTTAAIAGRSTNGTTIRATSQGGEPSPTGGAISDSYTLASGRRIPHQVVQILQYTLSAGWHILGTPGTPDRTTGETLVGAAGAPIKVGPVQYYNSATLRYVHGDDAATLLPRQGFWLFSYWGGESQSFIADREIAVRDWLSEIPLGAWVLYSPPGKIILGDMSALTVFAWDAAAQAYQPLDRGDTIEPLKGYWVYRTVAD